MVPPISTLPHLQLVVSGLACQRGERLLFRDIGFRLGAGEALLVTGENGSGKTTLLRALAGFLAPLAGSIALEGLTAGEHRREHLHYLGHRDGLRAALTARENLAFAAALAGKGGLAPAAALAELGLPQVADLPVGVLSAGQRRRVALARLLVARRPLWLLDEPTSALDTASQARVAGLIAAHCGAGGLVIAATHLALGIPAQSLVMGAR
jgi:heme exporter protein A